MFILLSPAKTLDFDTTPQTTTYSLPDFLPQAQQLIQILRQLSVQELGKLMKISPSLAELNHARNGHWHTPFSPDNAKQAMLAFKGDVYVGLAADTYTSADFDYAQRHLRILSGLYGLLRPLDLMQPYRLEMGTRLPNPKGKNLYHFWDTQLANALNKGLEKMNGDTIINLASNEYFKSIKQKTLKAKVITPVFKDFKNGQYKVISFWAKKARGMMASYIVKHRLQAVENVKDFNENGYCFNENLSTERQWVFTRDYNK